VPRPSNVVPLAAVATSVTAPVVPTWLTPKLAVTDGLSTPSASVTSVGDGEQPPATPVHSSDNTYRVEPVGVFELRFSTRKVVLPDDARAGSTFVGSFAVTTTPYTAIAFNCATPDRCRLAAVPVAVTLPFVPVELMNTLIGVTTLAPSATFTWAGVGVQIVATPSQMAVSPTVSGLAVLLLLFVIRKLTFRHPDKTASGVVTGPTAKFTNGVVLTVTLRFRTRA
jgi:hypothetical protein